MRSRVFLLFLSLVGSVALAAEDYQKLDDVNIKHQSEWSEVYNNRGREYKVKYNVFYQNNGPDVKLVSHSLDNGTNTVFEFAEKNSLPLYDCRPKENVNLYWVSFSTLNDETKFYSWKSENGNIRDIVAMYDPISINSDHAVILLTVQNRFDNESTIVHEIGHYWYDRFCWERSWVGGTEKFAQALEKYYIANEM